MLMAKASFQHVLRSRERMWDFPDGNIRTVMITWTLYLITIGGYGNRNSDGLRNVPDVTQLITGSTVICTPVGLMSNPHFFVWCPYSFWPMRFYCITPEGSWVSWVWSKSCLRAVVTCSTSGTEQLRIFASSSLIRSSSLSLGRSFFFALAFHS